ncbi:MAG: DUF202 domain-containing protein [Planctomycetaceae bacterium]|nr:MAG: DUF202 domain-containing protein [Planctomycetaceae bacterium]
MPLSESDPRVFFAAERTLMAWIRTGIAIMAIGLVVSRFGLFLRLMAARDAGPGEPTLVHPDPSALLGVTFVVVGSIAILIAAYQHSRFVRTLKPIDLAPAYSGNVSIAIALLIASLGGVLALYLCLT